MTKKRIATMATCIALVGAVAVGGTLALLTRESNTVTNTFTVGTGYKEGDLSLREHDVNQVLNTKDKFKQLRVVDVDNGAPSAITVKGAAVEFIEDSDFAGSRDAVMTAAMSAIK